MNFFSGYGSDGENDVQEGGERTFSSQDSDASSSESSVDSAAVRAAEAEARLRDFGSADQEGQSRLPSALDVFDEVDGPPSFLDPEATRPLAASSTHGVLQPAASTAQNEVGQQGRKGRVPGKDFDIATLAPKLKGQDRLREGAEKRAAGIIEVKAKRYKAEDEGPEGAQEYTPAQIAMLGGNVAAAGVEKKPTKPMPVSEFLDKGVGAAQLPRKNQDRKDREKLKRSAGQSTHAVWKSEAEMVLRQQFD